MKRICVFCGASPGARLEYADATVELARMLVAEGIGVVYGGGGVGLMGVLADAVLAEGGEIIGVIPRALVDREIAHRDVDMRVVGSMHERKALMAELSGYVQRTPFTGPCDCAAGAEYRKTLQARHVQQVASLTELTGWSHENVRQRMATGPDAYLPSVNVQAQQTWWQKMWHR